MQRRLIAFCIRDKNYICKYWSLFNFCQVFLQWYCLCSFTKQSVRSFITRKLHFAWFCWRSEDCVRFTHGPVGFTTSSEIECCQALYKVVECVITSPAATRRLTLIGYRITVCTRNKRISFSLHFTALQFPCYVCYILETDIVTCQVNMRKCIQTSQVNLTI